MSTTKVVRGYRVIRPLKSGGMGSVYVAEKLSTHQPFAIKFMLDHLVEEASYVVRFEREISALRSIRHPHVVDVFEWSLPQSGSAEPPFIVMELLEGEGLDHLLKRMNVLPAPMSVEITLQILDGLAAAHEVGVIHRDLGPTNIFLEERPGGNFHVKILDFGLARAAVGEGAVNVTQEGTLMGKPAYVAPEMFAGGNLDARSDVFACGVMLYRMLTGRFPYRETNQQMLWVERYADREGVDDYPSPRVFAPSIPESLDAVVAKSIRKNPRDRYQTAREMQSALLGVEEEIADAAETVLIVPTVKADGDSRSTVAGRDAVSLAGRKPRRIGLIAALIAGVGIVLAAVIVVVGRSGGSGAGASTSKPPVPSAGNPPNEVALPQVPIVVSGPPAASLNTAADEVHIVVLDVPPGALVTVGSAKLSGDPPEGDVPESGEAVELMVAADGFEIYRGSVVPDAHKTVRVEMKPLDSSVMDLTLEPPNAAVGPTVVDAGPPVRRDAGATARVDARPPRPDVRPVVSDAVGPAVRPDAAGAAVRPDAGGPSAGRDARRLIPGVGDAASRLPPDPFASPQRLPEKAPF